MLERKVDTVIFYGSQTGTAKAFALELNGFLLACGFRCIVLNLGSHDIRDLPSLPTTLVTTPLVIFVLATYGEGEPTDSARTFVDWLQEELPAADTNDLAGIDFSVFGLGSSLYAKYNSCAKLVDRCLRRRGARQVTALALGDEMDNLEGAFRDWQSALLASCYFQQTDYKTEAARGSPRGRLLFVLGRPPVGPGRLLLFTGEPQCIGSYACQQGPYTSKNPFLAPLITNRELYSNKAGRSCRHIELDISGSGLQYEAGDHLAVLPSNPDHLVHLMGRLLFLDLEEPFTLTPVDASLLGDQTPFPTPCTYLTAFTHYLDLTGPPRMHLFSVCSSYASDPKDAEFLSLLGSNSPEGRALYSEWIIEAHRGIVDCLVELTSFRPPAEVLLQTLGRLKPRFYSIASSPTVSPQTLHLTVGVLVKAVRKCRRFKGLASNWLRQQQPIADQSETAGPPPVPRLPVYVEVVPHFRLPRSHRIPVIMVAAGTGLAPFRGFIQERLHWAGPQGDRKVASPMYLFYGCRRQSQDFLYAEELTAASTLGLLHLYTAFSRDSLDDLGRKIYVQDRMREVASLLWRLIDQSHAQIYICGSGRTLAVDVRDCLRGIFVEQGGRSIEDADSYLQQMATDARLHTDVWG